MGKAEAEALGHVSSSFMAQFFISLLVAYKARWGNADREQYDDLTAAAMKWNRDYPDREKLAVWHDDNGNVWIRAVDRSTGQYTKPPEGLGEYMNQAFRDRGSERELAFTTETPEDVLQLNQGPATPTAEEEKKDDASAAPASAMNKKPARPQEEPSAAPHA